LGSDEPGSFEELSFANIVKYNEKKLRRIQRGTSASNIFNKSERNRLLRYGILIRRGMGKHVKWMVSERARDLLEE